MAKIIRKKNLNSHQDLLLVETQVSNKEAGHQYGEYARLSLITLSKKTDFHRISQVGASVISCKVFRKSVAKKESFYETERYKNSTQYKLYQEYNKLFDEVSSK